MEFVAPTGAERGDARRSAEKKRIEHRVSAALVGKYQVLIERSFQHARIGNTQNSAGPLDVVSHPEARLGLFVGGEAVIEVAPDSEVEGPISLGDGILN